MTWTVEIPGQPLSLGVAYRTRAIPMKRRGVTLQDATGKARVIHRPGLTEEAVAYRDMAFVLMKLAKPSKWVPQGQIRVIADIRCTRPVDSDNTWKLLLDALKRAIQHDDRFFLPAVRTYRSGVLPSEAGVLLTITTDEVLLPRL